MKGIGTLVRAATASKRVRADVSVPAVSGTLRVTWPSAFPSTAYTVSCVMESANGVAVTRITARTTTYIDVLCSNSNAVSAAAGTIHATGTPD